MIDTVRIHLERILGELETISIVRDPGFDEDQIQYIEEAIEALRNCLEEVS